MGDTQALPLSALFGLVWRHVLSVHSDLVGR
ncbi:conserved hypothetical protein (fragment) [Ralstonia solanacearum K60]